MLKYETYNVIDHNSSAWSHILKQASDVNNVGACYVGTICSFYKIIDDWGVNIKIKSNDLDLKKYDKLYIDRKCSVPRSKLKESLSHLNIKTVTDYTKADWLIISNDFFDDKSTVLRGLRLLPKEMIPDIISKLKKHNYNANKDFIKVLESCEHDVLLAYSSYILLDGFINDDSMQRYKYYINPNDIVQYVINNSNKVVHESDVIKLTNSAIVMTNELYKSMCKMFDSNDDGNITLAMETMANCSHDQSALYILLLIKDYGHLMRMSNTKSHVNFKSLMKYYDFDTYDLERQTIDTIVKILQTKNLLTEESITTLLPLAKEYMSVNYRRGLDSFYISEIKFNYDYLKKND